MIAKWLTRYEPAATVAILARVINEVRRCIESRRQILLSLSNGVRSFRAERAERKSHADAPSGAGATGWRRRRRPLQNAFANNSFMKERISYTESGRNGRNGWNEAHLWMHPQVHEPRVEEDGAAHSEEARTHARGRDHASHLREDRKRPPKSCINKRKGQLRILETRKMSS